MFNDVGIYAVDLYRLGVFQEVTVDGFLPLRKNKLLFASGNECVWVPLVEKAYAKFLGGYDKVNIADNVFS